MSLRQLRHAHVDAKPAHYIPGFVAWSWTGWIGGMVLWFLYVYFTYPTASAVARGEIGPMSLSQWVATSLLYVFVFLPPLVLSLYVGWLFFVVLRITGDRITVGRWFGAQQAAYSSTDIARWCFIGHRSREVSEAKSAWRIRIDFSDGSWVRLSRFAWNFRRLEAWLRGHAPVAFSAGPDSGIRRPPHTFVVRDVGMALIGIFGWVICWVVSAMCLMLIHGLKSGAVPSPGGIGSYVGPIAMGVITFLGGPYLAYCTGNVVRVDAPHIHVHRWWGLIQRTYREDDIKSWRVSLDPNPPWWRAPKGSSLVLRFVAGGSLLLGGQAANFHALHAYLKSRLALREQVRPAREKRRAA